jgi:hypothetical protein
LRASTHSPSPTSRSTTGSITPRIGRMGHNHSLKRTAEGRLRYYHTSAAAAA